MHKKENEFNWLKLRRNMMRQSNKKKLKMLKKEQIEKRENYKPKKNTNTKMHKKGKQNY